MSKDIKLIYDSQFQWYKNLSINNPDYKGIKNRLPAIKDLFHGFRIKKEQHYFDSLSKEDKSINIPYCLHWYEKQFCRPELILNPFRYMLPVISDAGELLKVKGKNIVNNYSIKLKGTDEKIYPDFNIKHITQHLAHSQLTPELLQQKYFWAMVIAKDDKHYPPFIVFDIDKFSEKSCDEKYKVRRGMLCDLIRDYTDKLSPATPLIFSSTSGKFDKAHLYFLLDDDVQSSFKLSELQAVIANRLEVETFERGGIEFFPGNNPIVLPLGYNSNLQELANNEVRAYIKTRGKPINNIDSLHRLVKQDENGKLQRITMDMIENWKSTSKPIFTGKVRANKSKASNAIRASTGATGATGNLDYQSYPRDAMSIEVPTDIDLHIFIPTIIIPKILRSYNGEPDYGKAEKRLRKWIQEKVNDNNSNRGAEQWLDTSNESNSYINFWEWWKIHYKPRTGKEPLKERTRELYDYLLKVIQDIEFDTDNQQAGFMKLEAFEYLYQIVKAFHPFHNSFQMTRSRREKGTDNYSQFVDLPRTMIDGWAIAGMSRGKEAQFRDAFKKAGILTISDSRWGQGLTKRWTLRIPFNFYSQNEIYDFTVEFHDMFLHLLKDKEQLTIVNRRNLTKLKNKFKLK